MQVLRSVAIKNFLTASTHPDLAALYSPEMEVQVKVDQDGGTRVEGDYKGRSWHAWTDGMTTWKSFRMPLNANSTPESNDGPMSYDLVEHAEGIGMTGWDWKFRLSRWVAFDFDAITGHSERHAGKLLDDELQEVERAAQEIPWVTVRKSTSGKGIHLYVTLEPTETENHNEHAALARAILGMMSGISGFDFHGKVDICGGNMWVWHRKMAGTDGLTLLKKGEILDTIPPNWRDHVAVVSGKRRRNLPLFVKENAAIQDDAERLFEELTGQQNRVPLDPEHHKLLEFLRSVNSMSEWDSDHHMLKTHTFDLQQAHEELQLRGPFKTNAQGTQRGADQNCFAYPMRKGVWAVRRYTPGVSEESTWSQDGAGWTRCFLNRDPDLATACKTVGAVEHKSGGFVFRHASEAQAAALQLGANINLPSWAGSRKAKLKEHKDGRLVVEIAHESTDNGEQMAGWNHEGKNWHRIYNVQASPPISQEIGNYDDVLRHVVTEADDDFGWTLKSDNMWRVEPLAHVRLALEAFGLDPKELKVVVGNSVFKPWTLVNRPFQPEYTGDRTWNKGAAQLRYAPSVDTDKLSFPNWMRVLQHIGEGLTDGVLMNPWCKASGIVSGADYLMVWIASLFQIPTEPLPYLFLYSPDQNTGKSIFHESLSILIKNGVVRADAALTSETGFNGELASAVLCVVEETDLRKHKSAYNRIKDWVTARQIPMHVKYQTPYTIPNTTHWVHCANEANACPIFSGDTRITMIRVPPLDPAQLIPKRTLLQLLEKEAPDFLAAMMTMELPPSGDRLAVPVVLTEEKRQSEKSNQTMLELFISEQVHAIDGAYILVADFFEQFKEWLDAGSVHEWTKQKVGRELPPQFCKGRLRANAKWAYGNMSWSARKPGDSVLPKLVVRNEFLVSMTEVKNGTQ